MTTHFRRVIRIRGEDSPNVRLAAAERMAGVPVSGKVLVPGVLTEEQYQQRRATWDNERQAIGLDAKFYVGPEVLLFPQEWLRRANQRWLELSSKPRLGETLGVDSAEGGDNTSYAVADELGLIELISKKTRDTTVVTEDVQHLMVKHRIPPERVFFDRGGGGYNHACVLRKKGLNVKTVAFGEALTMEPKHGMRLVSERIENSEERYVYVNRRAQMYGEFSNLLDPFSEPFALPPGRLGPQYERLLHQLSKIPRLLDDKGRYWLPSKGTRTDQMKKRGIKTLIEIIGHSPDEADAMVLAVYGLTLAFAGFTAGAAVLR